MICQWWFSGFTMTNGIRAFGCDEKIFGFLLRVLWRVLRFFLTASWWSSFVKFKLFEGILSEKFADSFLNNHDDNPSSLFSSRSFSNVKFSNSFFCSSQNDSNKQMIDERRGGYGMRRKVQCGRCLEPNSCDSELWRVEEKFFQVHVRETSAAAKLLWWT